MEVAGWEGAKMNDKDYNVPTALVHKELPDLKTVQDWMKKIWSFYPPIGNI